MFEQIKNVNGKKYAYFEHSFRIGKKVRKVSFYLPKGKKLDLDRFKIENELQIKKIAALRVKHIEKNQKYSRFFTYGKQLQNIEEKKVMFQVLLGMLAESDKELILDEFLRTFLVNSMAMEGGTISYEIAKAIDEKKKIRFKGINQLDVPLYLQLKQAHVILKDMKLRYPKQIKELHKVTYGGVYSFAGQFRKKEVTFGDLAKLAVTASPKNISKQYTQSLQRFYATKNKIYCFERIIEFHKDCQHVHGFEDGNSRLYRLIMFHQLIKLGYPPPLIKAAQSRAYRLSLVKAINNRNNTALLKFFYHAYNKTFNKFWLPILEEKISKSKKFTLL